MTTPIKHKQIALDYATGNDLVAGTDTHKVANSQSYHEALATGKQHWIWHEADPTDSPLAASTGSSLSGYGAMYYMRMTGDWDIGGFSYGLGLVIEADPSGPMAGGFGLVAPLSINVGPGIPSSTFPTPGVTHGYLGQFGSAAYGIGGLDVNLGTWNDPTLMGGETNCYRARQSFRDNNSTAYLGLIDGDHTGDCASFIAGTYTSWAAKAAALQLVSSGGDTPGFSRLATLVSEAQAATTWAGYFIGNVYATGVFTTSDPATKSEVKPIDAKRASAALRFEVTTHRKQNISEAAAKAHNERATKEFEIAKKIHSERTAQLVGLDKELTRSEFADSKQREKLSSARDQLAKIVGDAPQLNLVSSNTTEHTFAGVMADEVQKVFPELVTVNEHGELAIHETGVLFAMLAGAKAEIDALKAALEEQRARTAKIEEFVSTLKAAI